MGSFLTSWGLFLPLDFPHGLSSLLRDVVVYQVGTRGSSGALAALQMADHPIFI